MPSSARTSSARRPPTSAWSGPVGTSAGRVSVSCAISAVDIALWDCKARYLGVPLADLFGRCADEVAIYGSGGFITYDEETARAQLEQWVGDWEIPRVKIKIGEAWGGRPERDLARTAFARAVIGDDVALFVDANGGYSRKQAVRVGRALANSGRHLLVRGARVVGRSHGSASRPRRARRRCRCRRVRLRRDLLRPHGRSRGGGLPPDRRHSVRRLHHVASSSRRRGCAGLGGVSALRPESARPCRAERAPYAPHRVLP